MKFDKKLALWYLQNKRTMPWRETKNPYHIWLSEVILQQTRVAQGLPYYVKFIEKFPTVYDLAKASEESVLKLWQGLGYYSRARNLHAASKYVVNDCMGTFPNTYKGLLTLKGVGDYTASAIASICYNEAVPVVDGNVYRVLSRYFGIETPINSTAGVKEFKKLAASIMDTEHPGDYNQAIMEFGALQCKPKSPNCKVCPFNDSCVALANNKVIELPQKLKKLKVTKRYFNYFVFIINQKYTIISQRLGKGIWENMYEFPLMETDTAIVQDELMAMDQFKALSRNTSDHMTLYNEEYIVHKLSHQHLYTNFYVLEIFEAPELITGELLVPLAEISAYPVPVLIDKFIKTYGF